MAGHLRVKSPWSQLSIFLGLFGVAFILGYLIMGIIMLSMGIADVGSAGKLDLTNPKVLSGMKLIQAISSILVFLLPAAIFARIVQPNRTFQFLGVKPAQVKSMYVLAIVGIILAFPFAFWLGEINQLIPMPKWVGDIEKEATTQMQHFLKSESYLDVLVNVLIIAFIPALCEEICFRGALQRIMIHITKNAWTGIIITSILFSAFHFQFQGFLPRMFLGVFLGAVYWYSGSIWPSILAHFVYNGVQVVAVSYAPELVESNPSVSIYLAILSGFLTLGILWVFRLYSTVTYRNTYEPDDLRRNSEFLV
jgi:membrane protease YdiL (CAAX protease family)